MARRLAARPVWERRFVRPGLVICHRILPSPRPMFPQPVFFLKTQACVSTNTWREESQAMGVLEVTSIKPGFTGEPLMRKWSSPESKTFVFATVAYASRSEERRVGKE